MNPAVDWERASAGGRSNRGISALLSANSPAQSSPRTGISTPIEADSPSFTGSPLNDDSTSQSVANSVYEFPRENGRTYHGYRAGTYHFPNDPSENDRLDFQFEILKYAFSDRNYFAPLKNPKTILDIGTGTGQWAIEMGDEFPDAEIQATDLSPIQPSQVPANVHFFIDDASEDDWALPQSYFDYIHTRVLLGCFIDFRDIVKKGFYYTKPGGYMESQEIMSTPYCDDGTMPPDWPFLEWAKLGDKAAMEADRPLRIANRMKRWYEAEGFVDVQERVFKLPMNTWPRDKHLKTLGSMAEDNWLAGLQGFSMAPFSRVLNWNKNEIEVYLINVRKAIQDRHVHAYHKIYVVWGRKPENIPQMSFPSKGVPVPSNAPPTPASMSASHTRPSTATTAPLHSSEAEVPESASSEQVLPILSPDESTNPQSVAENLPTTDSTETEPAAVTRSSAEMKANI